MSPVETQVSVTDTPPITQQHNSITVGSWYCTNIAEYSAGFPSCFVNQVKDLEVPGVHLLHERFVLLQHWVEPELLSSLKTH